MDALFFDCNCTEREGRREFEINSYNKTSLMHNFLKFIFGIKLYVFRTFPVSITRSFHCTHSSVLCHRGLLIACVQDQDGTEFHPDPARKRSANMYDI